MAGTDEIDVMPGAEPRSIPGGPNGVLVVHGFSGNPQSMRGLAQAFGAAGFAVELPRLPGHGTSAADLATTTMEDWSGTVERVYEELVARCERVVLAGLSMGAMLAARLTAGHPEIAGLIVINGAFAAPDAAVRVGLEQVVAAGVPLIPGPGNDIADPAQTELAYPEVPPQALLSLVVALDELPAELARITCPSLVITSDQDHVVPPGSSELFVTSVAGPVEQMRLTKSFHVATLDYEASELEARAVDFAQRVTKPG
jgi:carboxylesterase